MPTQGQLKLMEDLENFVRKAPGETWVKMEVVMNMGFDTAAYLIANGHISKEQVMEIFENKLERLQDYKEH